MKYSFIPVFVLSVLLSVFVFKSIFNSDGKKQVSELEGKMQEKFYPYEWSYLKKTWPYLQADPRAYIDAIEQAKELHKQTAEQRL